MQGGRAQAAQLVFVVLLLAVIAFAALARKLRLPYPIVLVLAGLLVSFVPGLPRITLDPDFIFYVVLPPLLSAAAWVTSWREFSYNLVSIASLAIGLVSFTVAGVALSAPFILPAFDWRTGLVLGAVVSTTDAIAASTIARQMGLPRRIVDVLEGESLVNDATGLLALEFGVSILVSGMPPSAVHALLRFGQLVVGGLAVGLVIAWLVRWVETRIDDGPIEIAISILVPYAAYLIAEGVHASGVLAVVAAGLFLSRKSSQFFSPTVRIQVYAVWGALTFVLNGLVFLTIGLQLPLVLAGIREYGLGTLALSGAAFSGLVIALAAALALPHNLPGGVPFPQRNLIVFITFCVILATLVAQGLTLPLLVRLLGLQGSAGPACEEREARRIAVESALGHLEQSRPRDRPDLAPVYDDLALHYRRRLAGLTRDASSQQGQPVDPDHHSRYRDLSRELAKIERDAAIRLRDEGRIDDDALRQIEHELDLTEARLQEARAGV